jgi:aspartyl-tRNA(Asn)/glutamyl-tRNA(Gln) amidotransferase subunit C
MSNRVTLEDVRRVAELANLELMPVEETTMQRDLNAILGYIAELEQLDTKNVEPLEQVAQLLDANANPSLRPDVIMPSLDRATVLAQAPEANASFFKVPKVIER